jgi:cycloeucalenol cycloisomerase
MHTNTDAPRWFSENPGKAWAEKCFLILSPVWMALVGLNMVLSLTKGLGDPGYLIQGLVVALPFVLVPALLSPENRERAWHQTYWFKANLYIAVFGFFGNYVGSEYFFDVLGMVYNYPDIHWNADAALVGSGVQKVPVLMYLMTHAYFMTYHSSATVVLRRIRTSGLPLMGLVFPLVVFAVGYFWAWMETRAMANPLMAGSFYYQKMETMLAYGSAVYATYFIASFPIYYFIDEKPARPWGLLQVVAGALSASMLTFYMLDFIAHAIGTI